MMNRMGSERLVPEVAATVARSDDGIAQRVIEAITARPFVPSAEICKNFGITREQLLSVYAQARV